MKKLTAIVLLVALTLPLVSCGDTESSTESAEPAVSTVPSATPSVEPSIEPSAEPSEPPADDIDAYWEGRVLTSDSGDLVMDATRWVRNYYRSLYASVAPYESTYATLAAARITNFRSDGFELYTECYFLNSSGGERLVDEYATAADDSDAWYLRTICFDFEEVDDGYRYVGISAPTESTLDCTMNTTVVRDGREIAGLESDIWQLETLLGTIANGDMLDTLPSDAEYIGSLNYSYSDTSAEWEFYSYTRVIDKWNSYTSTVAQCAATGEVVETGMLQDLYLYKPTAQELADEIDKRIGKQCMLSRMDGYYFTMPEETQALLDVLKTVLLGEETRLYNYSRDSMRFSAYDDLYLSGISLGFEEGWDKPGSLLYIRMNLDDGSNYSLVANSAEKVYTEVRKLMQNKLDTLRDGTFLSEAKDWEPVTMTDEIQLLNRAYRLFGIFDMSSIIEAMPMDTEPIIKDEKYYYYDLAPLNDPNADDYYAHLGSYANFTEYTRSVFSDDVAKSLLNNGMYIEGPNGELYGRGFGRGGMNPSIGATLAYYKFEPAEGILVVRAIHERYTSHDGWQTEEYVGEGAWDTVFVKEDGAWKVKYISFDV